VTIWYGSGPGSADPYLLLTDPASSPDTVFVKVFFLIFFEGTCAAGFALLNLPKGKSLGRSKPATNSSNEQAH
jgi:hypothetical protein